jgi:hypothetical protein
MPDTAHLAIGHNNPPEPIIDPINDPAPPAQSVLERWLASFKAALEIRNEATIARYREIELGIANVPASIESATDAAQVTDFLAQAAGHIEAGAKVHKAEKALFLGAGKIIDACLLHRGQALAEKLGPVKARLKSYYEVLAHEERRRREAERRAAAEAAQQADQEAADARAEAAQQANVDRAAAARRIGDAEKAEEAAGHARKRAATPDARPQIRGDYGAVAYTQTRWQFEVVDLDAVPREYMSLDVAVVREAIEKDGVREIPGLKIFAVEHLRVKGS